MAAPGQKAPHPPEGVKEGNGRDQNCRQPGKGDAPPPAEQDHRPQRPQQPAIKDKAPGEIPGSKQGGIGDQQGQVGSQLGQPGQQIEQLGPHQRPQDAQPEGLLRLPGVLAPAAQLVVEIEPGGSAAQQGQQTIGGDGPSAQNKKWQHNTKR